MYKCFNLSLDYASFQNEVGSGELDSFEQIGRGLFNKNKEVFGGSLLRLSNEGVLSASELSNVYFPCVPAHVFISHSHRDEKLALAFAGWLYKKFGIIAFIDSLAWGYCNDLLKGIDLKYNLRDDGVTFDYNKRNISTSHVHCLLTSSLIKMMDSCECVFFLNTKNSVVNSEQGISTLSPWLYIELSALAVMRVKCPGRGVVVKAARFDESIIPPSEVVIQYDLNLSGLRKLDCSLLAKWEGGFSSQYDCSGPLDALDCLYDID